jgi:hypothetical protein
MELRMPREIGYVDREGAVLLILGVKGEESIIHGEIIRGNIIQILISF